MALCVACTSSSRRCRAHGVVGVPATRAMVADIRMMCEGLLAPWPPTILAEAWRNVTGLWFGLGLQGLTTSESFSRYMRCCAWTS